MGRRSVLQGLAGVAGAAALAGCGRRGAGSEDPKKLQVMNWEKTEGTPLGDAIHAFERKSGIDVTIQPAPTSDYDTKMRVALASGTAPDIVRINDDYVRGFSDTGSLLDLTTYIKRDRLDISQFAGPVYNFPLQPDGKHTAWVIGYEPRLIYYNVDWFKSAGVRLPPTTWTGDGWSWDDFVDTAKKLTKGAGKWGCLVYLDTGVEQTFSINNGSPTGIYSKDGKKFTLSEPKGVEAIQWAADLTNKHKVQPPWSELQQVNTDTTFFAEQKVAMLFDTFGVTPYFRENVKDFTWDIAPPPKRIDQRTESSVVVFAVPKSAGNPDGAWELLKFLSGPEGGAILAEGKQYTPINNEAAKAVKPDKSSPAHLDLFAEAGSHLTQPNQTSNTLAARDIYRPALDDVYLGNATAEDVLTHVTPKVDDALSTSG
ncbi:MAG TPA: sugar ABC transporter substrate-binding protein [Mycobacteriales bacterium]|nr:sugar ABC transporter substrate-binding protein [Mycobacteriales bacterium]